MRERLDSCEASERFLRASASLSFACAASALASRSSRSSDDEVHPVDLIVEGRMLDWMCSIVGTSEIGVLRDSVSCTLTTGAAAYTDALDTVIAGVACDDVAVSSGVNASDEMIETTSITADESESVSIS